MSIFVAQFYDEKGQLCKPLKEGQRFEYPNSTSGIETSLAYKGNEFVHRESILLPSCDRETEQLYKYRLSDIPNANFVEDLHGNLVVWVFEYNERKWKNVSTQNGCFERLFAEKLTISTFLITCGPQVDKQCETKLCVPMCCGTNAVYDLYYNGTKNPVCKPPQSTPPTEHLKLRVKEYGEEKALSISNFVLFYLHYTLERLCSGNASSPFTYTDVHNIVYIKAHNGFRLKLNGEFLYPSEFCIGHFEGFEKNDTVNLKRDLKIRRCGNRQRQQDINAKLLPSLSGVSVIFLIIALIYEWQHERFKVQGAVRICVIISLLVFNTLMTSKYFYQVLLAFWPKTCTTIAFLSQFAYVSTMSWVCVLSYDVWLTFRKFEGRKNVLSKRKVTGFMQPKFKLYLLVASGTPTLLFILTISMNYASSITSSYIVRPDMGKLHCWGPSGTLSRIFYLYVPVLVILLINLTFFVQFSRNYCFGTWYQAKGNTAVESDFKDKFQVVAKLFILMGGFWASDVASSLALAYGPRDSKSRLTLVVTILDLISYSNGVFVCLAVTLNTKTIKSAKKLLHTLSKKSESTIETN